MELSEFISALRKALSEVLVPELKGIKEEIVNLKEENKKIREEMNLRFEKVYEDMKELREEMNLRFEKVYEEMKELRKEMNLRFEKIYEEMKNMKEDIIILKQGQKEIISKLDIDRRMIKLENFMEEVKKTLKIEVA
jgi:predicted nucleotide-binding protein (sugar kinase/HSP70/actin superfamily)